MFIAGEVISKLISTHGSAGIVGQEALSDAKAKTLYRILDAYPEVFQPVNDKAVRSRMNICFRCKDPETERVFLEGAEARFLQGLKGRKYYSYVECQRGADSNVTTDRSVGGIRVSN